MKFNNFPKVYEKVRHFHPGFGTVKVTYTVGDNVAWVITSVRSPKDQFSRKTGRQVISEREAAGFRIPIPANLDSKKLSTHDEINEFLDLVMENFSTLFGE